MAEDKGQADARRNAQIDAMVQSRVTAMMAAGGVSHSVASQEALFMLPREFVRAYEELFDTALKLDSGSHTGAGIAQGEVGKGPADAPLPGTVKGLRVDSGKNAGSAPRVGAGGKRYKNNWTVKDDRALALKARLDKRLRAMAREIAEVLADSGRAARDQAMGPGRQAGMGAAEGRCTGCGRTLAIEWRFCPNDGIERGTETGSVG